MIRTFLEKRRAKKVLEKYVSPEVVASVLRGDDLKRQPLKPARIEFVLVFVSGDSPEEVSERVGRVAEIASSHDAVVHDLIGPLAVMAFGAIPVKSPPSGNRSSLVQQLNKELSSHVKIVHGTADGHCGLIGSKYRMSYSFLLPRFDAILGALCRLEYGQIQEFK